MKTIAIVFLWLVFSAGVMAEIIGDTDDPMVIGGGARPIGMGRAFTAVGDDADAPLINPAAVATIKAPQVMTMFTNLLGDIYYSEYCAALPSKVGTFGGAYVATGVNHVLTPVGSTEVYSDYYDNLFVATYSSSLAHFFDYGQNIFLGINGKYFARGWRGGVNQEAAGWSADVGLKYIHNPYVSFGLNNQNIVPVSLGGTIKESSGAEEAVAGRIKAGVALRPIYFNRKWLITSDLDIPSYSARPTTGHLGTEIEVSPNVMLRAGIEQTVDASASSKTSWNPSFGTSFGAGGFRVDYAFHANYNDPALATNYISVSYQGKPSDTIRGEVD